VLLAAVVRIALNAIFRSPFPLQVEMRVPFDPTTFPSSGRTYLVYELYLTNFSDSAVTIRQIDVLDADSATNPRVASFASEALEAMLQRVGKNGFAFSSNVRKIAPGTSVIVFMWIPFGPEARTPDHLRHRLLTSESALEGPVIGTHHTELHVLGPPLEGAVWRADDGPSNVRDNHHRRGVVILDGRAVDSRRYAIDWVKYEQGVRLSGDQRDKRSYYAYGRPVLAVADAAVVIARDGLPENIPGHGLAFHPAVPITLDTLGGNMITLDLGDGQFAYYFHLQPASLRVKVGDRVRRGQEIARVGCSGDAREPHLHFEVTTSSEPLGGEGVPYVIDRYRTLTANHTWQSSTRGLPLDGMLIDFGQDVRLERHSID
jgi:hypothetical protein